MRTEKDPSSEVSVMNLSLSSSKMLLSWDQVTVRFSLGLASMSQYREALSPSTVVMFSSIMVTRGESEGGEKSYLQTINIFSLTHYVQPCAGLYGDGHNIIYGVTLDSIIVVCFYRSEDDPAQSLYCLVLLDTA